MPRNKRKGPRAGPTEDPTAEVDAEVEEACRMIHEEFAINAPKLRKWSIDEFILGSILGEGRYGKVYSAVQKEGAHQLAIKAIANREIEKDKMSEQLSYEIIIHCNARHEYIVPLLNFFSDRDFTYLIMPLEKGGSLFDFMGKQPFRKVRPDLVAKFVTQIAQALSHLHSQLFIHRDIKPENILLDENCNAKLADFGWSIPAPLKSRRVCGTTCYMAPEMVKRKVYDVEIDLWSLGVLCFELINGISPFEPRGRMSEAQKNAKTLSNIVLGRFNCPKAMPAGAQDLVSKLLKANPKKRISLEMVVEHSWVKGLYKEETT